MAATRMTVAEAVFLLMQADPLEEIEFDVIARVTVTPVSKTEKPGVSVKKQVFDVLEGLGDPADAKVDDLVFFDYTNAGNGPVTRVGFVLKTDYGKILLEDLSVGGNPRWFDHDFIEDIYLLS